VAVRQPKGWRCLGGPRPFFSKDPGRFANVPRQQTPEPPKDLGAAGRAAWNYVWRHRWIVPERHMMLVERYCRTRDLLQQAIATVAAEGLMSVGSHGQQRAHPCMAAIRLMSTESRLMELELGLTPVAESRAGIPKELPTLSIDEQIQRRRAYLQPVDDDDYGDPRSQLKPIAPA
jgi:P27 family predicted phage terminase small subunit